MTADCHFNIKFAVYFNEKRTKSSFYFFYNNMIRRFFQEQRKYNKEEVLNLTQIRPWTYLSSMPSFFVSLIHFSTYYVLFVSEEKKIVSMYDENSF